MTNATETKTVRTPAQAAAIRRSYGLKKAAEARAAARERHIKAGVARKIQKRKLDAWKANKIDTFYKDRSKAQKAAKAAAAA